MPQPFVFSKFLGALGDSYLFFLVTGVWKRVTIIAFAAPRSRVSAAIAQNAIAAAMSEPSAAHGGSSRDSCIAIIGIQRL